MSLIAAKKQLQKDRSILMRQVERIDGALAALAGKSTNGFQARIMFKHSPATKRKIAASQRKRLAAARKK